MKMKNTNQKLLVSSGMIILCLFLFIVFPTENLFQKTISYITFLVAVPLLYVKIVLKEKLRRYGLQKGEWKKGIFWAISSLLISLAILYLLINYFGFSYKYIFPSPVGEKFFYFVLYEILLVGIYVFMYEFFFRGFVMFSFAGVARFWSVIIQFILFLTFVFFIGGLKWTMAYYIILAPLAGFTAYRSRSIIYSLASSWIFIIIADSWVIKILKQ